MGLYINGKGVASFGEASSSGYSAHTACLPVNKGDIISRSGGYTVFIPCK